MAQRPQRSSLPDLVFPDLRPAVAAALDTPEVVALLDAMIVRGWRPRQLRDRVGSLPVQSAPTEDARVIVDALRALLEQQSPQESYDEELRRRVRSEQDARDAAQQPAAPEERARWVSMIRSGLKGRSQVPFGPPVRLRPDCSLCTGEAEFFVRRDVHLCGSCVDLLAAGEVRADRATGT